MGAIFLLELTREKILLGYRSFVSASLFRFSILSLYGDGKASEKIVAESLK